jgi:soluble lytic murein transglycosylase-like protein
MIRDAFPDGQTEEVALYVAQRESNLRPGVTSSCCTGLFQIYYKWHKVRLARLGIRTEADLLDPVLNIRAAADIYRTNGWGPWCTRGLKARYPKLRGCR